MGVNINETAHFEKNCLQVENKRKLYQESQNVGVTMKSWSKRFID